MARWGEWDRILNKIIASRSIDMTQSTSHSSGGRRTPFLDTGRHLSPYLCKRYRLDEVRSFLRKQLTCSFRARGMAKTSYADVCRLILECPTIRSYEPRLFVIGGTVRDAVYCANVPRRTEAQRYAQFRQVAHDIDLTLVLAKDHNRHVHDLSTRIDTWLQSNLPGIKIRNASRSGKVGHFLRVRVGDDSDQPIELAYIEHPHTLQKREAPYFYHGPSHAYLLDSPCNTLLYEVATDTVYDPTRRGLHDAARRIWRCPLPIPNTFPWAFYRTYIDRHQAVPIEHWNAGIQGCVQWVVKGPTRRNVRTGRLSWTSRRKTMNVRASKFAKRGYRIPASTRKLLALPLFKDL